VAVTFKRMAASWSIDIYIYNTRCVWAGWTFFSSALKYTTITIVLSLYHTIPLLANKESKTNHITCKTPSTSHNDFWAFLSILKEFPKVQTRTHEWACLRSTGCGINDRMALYSTWELYQNS
jgi:hypothetical protein